MPKDKIILEDVLAEIEDTLPDTCLHWYEIKHVSAYKARMSLIEGYYLHYRIASADVDRVIWLGVEPLEIGKNFDRWIKKWMVQ